MPVEGIVEIGKDLEQGIGVGGAKAVPDDVQDGKDDVDAEIKKQVGLSVVWGGFLKIISVGIPTYSGVKTGF